MLVVKQPAVLRLWLFMFVGAVVMYYCPYHQHFCECWFFVSGGGAYGCTVPVTQVAN
jgi:hypothetical protein